MSEHEYEAWVEHDDERVLGQGVFPHQLATWWEHGEGAAKIRWGEPGDFMRCVRLAMSKAHMTPDQAKGFCNVRHRAVLGKAPGQEHKKSLADYGIVDAREVVPMDSPTDGNCGCDQKKHDRLVTMRAVDNSAWDGPAAMSKCAKSDNPASCYGAICAGRKAGDPSNQDSWALPHHSAPGQPANAAGVSSALGRLGQTKGLQNAEAARRHLEAHQRAIRGQRGDVMGDAERRYTPTVVEIRVARDRHRIGGYAATFDRLSRNLGGFVEVVERSFFNKSRADGWPGVIARYNHDDNMLLGTTGAQTLDLRIDETGLMYEVDPPQARQDILELVERGDVRYSSFAFRVMSGGDEWTMTDQGYPLRRLHEGQLVDVSPVVSPAYMDTSVGVRSLANFLSVDESEVMEAIKADEVRKFFKRTSDGGAPVSKPAPKPGMFGAKAKMALLARKDDPWQ